MVCRLQFLLMKKAVAGIMRSQVRVENTTDQVCNTLADISTLYLERLSSSIKQSAELSGRTQVCLEDVLNIFDEWGIDIEELSEEHILPYEPQLNGFNEISSNPLNTPSSPISVYEYFSRDSNIEAYHHESHDEEEVSHNQQGELSSIEYIDYEEYLKVDQPTNEELFLKCLPEKPQKASQLKEIDTSVSTSSVSSLPTIPSQSIKPRKTTRSEMEDLSKPLETDSMHAIKRLCNKRSKIHSSTVKNFNDIVNDHDKSFLDMLADVKSNCDLHEIERKNPLMEMNVIINQNQSNPDTHGLPYLPFFSPIDVLFQQNVPSIIQSSFVSSVVPPLSRQEFLNVGTIPQPTWLQPSQPLSSPPAPPTPVKKSIRKAIGHSFTSDSPAPKIKLKFKNSTSPSENDSRSLNDQPISPLPEAKHYSRSNSNFSTVVKAKPDGVTPPAYQNGASSERINCVCSRPDFDDGLFMVSCDKCLEWFHGNCVGVFPHQELNSWYCERCINRKKEKAARRKAF